MKLFLKQNKMTLLIGLIFIAHACSPNEETLTSNDLLNHEASISFDKQNDQKVNVFKGPEVQYGKGKARSWISINVEGIPVEIGIELSKGVFANLSELAIGHELTTVLPLHYKAKEITPFEHIGLNFQPEGHGPVFWSEHFDFHFYTITNEERLAIPPYDANDPSIVDAYNAFPDMTKMPMDYFKFPFSGGAYPQMGKHWVPQDWQTGYSPFTHVMILGSYNQKNNFIEPMITVDYLISGEEFSGAYSQPTTFEESGNNYPSAYNIYHNNETGSVYISLSNFVKR